MGEDFKPDYVPDYVPGYAPDYAETVPALPTYHRCAIAEDLPEVARR
jgi:hypothetical protein